MSLGEYNPPHCPIGLDRTGQADTVSIDEAALEAVANGGSIDIVFPMPKLPPSSLNRQPISQPPTQPAETDIAPPESSNKENAAPGDHQTPPSTEPTIPSSSANERVPDSQPQSSAQQTNDTLPPPLALLLKSIRFAIQSLFTTKPPHTIQRFAELILQPTAHYRTLPAYLRAVDRVVSVTSGADIFPFNTNTGSELSNGLLHPTNSAGTYLAPDYTHGLGSDESLGGALLTPIPWLTNTSFEEDGIIEPEENGHLAAQETETGVSTVAPTVEGEESTTTTASPPTESPDEVPHARGPAVVGVEDLGLQDGKGVEMNLEAQQTATANDPAESNAASSEDSVLGDAKTSAESGSADKDGDIVLDDPTPKEQEPKTEEATAVPQAGEEKSEAVGDSAQTTEAGKE
ncbi:Protein phosphatase 4 core regulatory subunit R2 [Penicillium angulare]|uniref:Protein phosphatase 4 core regulatory subunit R2 n=1 Tax=Penicillium angulare TaxID=116970 RepID=UPI0025403C9A|nr:Protein phosphatase 4 core regulatory subunit R2 [Penicillium angulare]KAJ5281192.1 Protein phosphatase 4 core regulatory subunit R2 [Penicillium angulare]